MHKSNYVCPHCGEPVNSNGLCSSCEKRFRYFYSWKSKINSSSRSTTLHKYLEVINFYVALRDSGVTHLVPKNLNNQKERVEAMLNGSFVNGSFEYFEDPLYCKDCGALVDMGVWYSKRIRCVNCTKRYKRYQALMARVAVLDFDECAELNGILDEYVEQMKHDRWAPNIPVVRAKVKRRLGELEW